MMIQQMTAQKTAPWKGQAPPDDLSALESAMAPISPKPLLSARHTLIPGLNVLEQEEKKWALQTPPAPVMKKLTGSAASQQKQRKKEQQQQSSDGELPGADQWPPALK